MNKENIKIKILVVLLLVLAFVVVKPNLYYYFWDRIESLHEAKGEILLDFSSLSSDTSESDILHKYSYFKGACQTEASLSYNKSCLIYVKKVNGIDCWRIVFFFKKDRLAQVKIDVTSSGQKQMFEQLTKEFGQPKMVSSDQYGVPIVRWILRNGVILMNNRPYTLLDWIKELRNRPGKVLYQFMTNQFLWINRPDMLPLYK